MEFLSVWQFSFGLSIGLFAELQIENKITQTQRIRKCKTQHRKNTSFDLVLYFVADSEKSAER